MPSSNVKKVADNIGKVLSTTDNTELQDEKGNKIVVPAGFKITNDATTVDKGIVIEDATRVATAESQFVWVPVGTITKSDGSKVTIKLGRYDFNQITGEESNYKGNCVEEDSRDTANFKNYGNKIAKDINDFKTKASAERSGGFYIGRYESGITGYDENAITTTNSNQEKSWTGYTNAEGKKLQLVCKSGQQVWNYVTQNKAADLAQDMYKSDKFTSDLMNSYAWDTTITFIQKCTSQTKYSYQTSLNKGVSPEQTGTTDKQCNIFDMASNVSEWTTETTDYSKAPSGCRGGKYKDSQNNLYASDRMRNRIYYGSDDIGFRPFLYL